MTTDNDRDAWVREFAAREDLRLSDDVIAERYWDKSDGDDTFMGGHRRIADAATAKATLAAYALYEKGEHNLRLLADEALRLQERIAQLEAALEHARIAIAGARENGVLHMGFLSEELLQHINTALAAKPQAGGKK